MGSDSLVGWLEGRLSDERAFLEGMHEEICEDLRTALTSGADPRLGLEPPLFRCPRLLFGEQLSDLEPTVSPMQLQGLTGLDRCSDAPSSPTTSRLPPPPRNPLQRAKIRTFLDSALAMPGKPDSRRTLQSFACPVDSRTGSMLAENMSPTNQEDTDDVTHTMSPRQMVKQTTPVERMAARDEALHNDGLSETPVERNPSSWLIGFVGGIIGGSCFEIVFAVLIMSSAIVMTLEVQYKSVSLGEAVGWTDAGGEPPSELSWPGAKPIFFVCNFFFGFAFALEVFLKCVVQGRLFFVSAWSVFDLTVTFFWFVETWAQYGMPVNPMLFRVVRLLRLLRLLRFVKMIELFDVLSLMVGSIKASVSVLFWGTIVLVMIMLMFGMFLNSLLTDTMEDDEIDQNLRKNIYEYFGSFSRVMITMFEITLGNWVPVCRLLADNVSEWYGFIFLGYRCVVGFAVVKVITGVFLHETFKCAAMDDDLMVQAKERQKAKFIKKMRKLVEATDSSGDGQVSFLEFQEIVKDPRVLTWLQAMEFNVTDPETVFSFFAGAEFRTGNITADTTISADELCRGIARLKGGAQELDLLMLMAQARQIQLTVEEHRWEFTQAVADLEELMRQHGQGSAGTRQVL